MSSGNRRKQGKLITDKKARNPLFSVSELTKNNVNFIKINVAFKRFETFKKISMHNMPGRRAISQKKISAKKHLLKHYSYT